MNRYAILPFLFSAALIANDITIQPYVKAGGGAETFRWKMDHESNANNCFTTAEWKSIPFGGFEIGVKAYPFESLYGSFWADYWFDIRTSWYGNVGKKDFKGSFRQAELFASPLTVETKTASYHAGDFIFDIGCDFCLSQNLTLAHVLGFSAKKQHFHNSSGRLEIPANLNEEIAGLSLHDFHYEAGWRDVWTGLQLDWRPLDCVSIIASGNYHYGRLIGHGHWHLNEELVDGRSSFNHDKVNQNGIYQGISGNVEIAYDVPYSCWDFTLNCGYRYLLKTSGKDKTKTHEIISMEDGTIASDEFRHLNNVYRISSRTLCISLGANYDF